MTFKIKTLIEKRIIYIIAVAVLYAAAISTLNFVSEPKIGYINTGELLEKYPAAIEAREKLQAKIDEWSENVKTLETELNQLNHQIAENGAKLNKKALAEKQEAIKQKQNDYLRYSRAVQEKAAKLEQELMQPVFDEINVSLKDFGREKGHRIILGTLSGGNILYAEEGSDLTGEFLGFANTISHK